ncbi:TRAP transporter large permease [Proteiniclasticum sp. C24MP]|uniref:TRAP transporter large permease n=1 Tax=Proteiniclasticum sp. C24MP TaxID=3374101 RepID=UPI003754A0A6
MEIGVVLLIVFAVLMIIGVPIAVSLAFSAIVTVFVTDSFAITAIIHRMIGSTNSYTLLAIPFFILAAKLMNTGSITKRIFRAAAAWVGHIPGGLGHANIVASIIFSGMSGSAVADAGGLGQVEIQAMKDEGFDPEFSAAVTAASATVGPIIPPSVPMVVYGMMAEVSVGALFMGGFIPGLILGLATMILVYIIAKKRNYPKHAFSFREVVVSTKSAFLSLLTPVIIIGGIWGGIFSPTEAAVVAVGYSFILSVIVYRELTLKDVWKEMKQTAVDSAAILFIIAGAAAFSWLVAMTGVTNNLAQFLTSMTDSKVVILLILNITFLILGMFMEALSVLTITVPFLIPLMGAYNIDPIHLGVVIVLNLMIGLVTPPVGTSLFICAKQAKISIESMYRAILPFLVPLIIVLFLITYVEELVLFLPGLLG